MVDFPKKKAISIRIDSDVLEFFRQYPMYQRHINAVLRHYMKDQKRRKEKRDKD